MVSELPKPYACLCRSRQELVDLAPRNNAFYEATGTLNANKRHRNGLPGCHLGKKRALDCIHGAIGISLSDAQCRLMFLP